MNNRLSIPELAGLLVEYTGTDKKTAERFLKELVLVVREGVFQDKVVKIKGIGTFKIILVENRESVDVNTGNRILIPEHYKFSYTPDKDLKEQVNKPFSFFETVEINDTVDLSVMENTTYQAEPVVEGIPEVKEDRVSSEEVIKIEEAIVSEVPVEVKDSETIPEKVLIEPIESAEEILIEETAEEPISLDTTEESIPEQEIVPTEIPPVVKELEVRCDPVEEKPVQKRSLVKIISIVASVLILAAGGGLFFVNRQKTAAQNQSAVDELADIAEEIVDSYIYEMYPEAAENSVSYQEGEDISESETPATVQETEPVLPTPQTQAEPSTPEERTTTPAASSLSHNKDTKTTIKPGDRLTVISLEHYGNKVFWVYIFEHNKNTIKDPNNIPAGSEITIPSAQTYGIDPDNAESIEKAKTLQSSILRRFESGY